MANPKFRPTQFATREQVDKLFGGLADEMDGEIRAVMGMQEDVLARLRVYERALSSLLDDVESLSNVLVDAGLLEHDDEPVEDRDDYEVDPEGFEGEPDVADLTDDLDLGYGPVDETELEPEHHIASDDGMPEALNIASKDARQLEIRARRRQIAMEQGVRNFEEGNEDPMAAAAQDLEPEEAGNMVTDVPDEGIIIPSSSADEERYRDV